jgi:hypothetical protein
MFAPGVEWILAEELMSYFQSLLRRFRPRPERSPRAAVVDQLESRQMLSVSALNAVPAVSNVYLTGSPVACTGIVVQFNESVDPGGAQEMQAYYAGKLPPVVTKSSFDWTQLLGFLAKPKTYLVQDGRLGFLSASYDDPSQSVTLTPVRPFNAIVLLRLLKVRGTTSNAVMDTDGIPLNGGMDTFVSWAPHVVKSFTYLDADLDRVTINLRGPGMIVAFLQTRTDRQPMIFIRGGNSRSILTGVVRQSITGNGVATLAELQGAGAIQDNLTSNPEFQILTVQS